MERNRTLLTKNLILTDDFYDLLLKEKVLPQSMIADVKVRQSVLYDVILGLLVV